MFMFIGHSYGGLVIKEAFISAFEYQEHRPVNIVQQTRAIIFMGTPHRGSDESKFGLIIARMLGFFRLQSNSDILRPMEYDSPELGEMHQRFEAISQNVMGANFYEARKFRSFLGLRWTYVVKPASAKMDRPKWENIPLLTDHTGLNKFWRKDFTYKRVCDKLISLIEIILQVEHSTTSVYEVPLRSKKQYIERNELSANLERSLSTRGSIVAIVGLGGMGKTQLALRYAESHRSRYNVILWIDVTSEETLLSSFRQCAQALDIFPNYSNASENLGNTDTVRIVLRWLQQRDDRHGETLLIYDNMDEFSMRIENFLPSRLHGSIIVTTRNVQSLAMFPEGTHRVNVADMTSPEAQMLLLRYLDLNATEVPKGTQDLSRQICEAMHWSPLAIHLAGTQISLDVVSGQYINLSVTTYLLERFLQDIHTYKDDIFKAETAKGMSSYDLTIYTVLDSSLQAIDKNFQHFHSRQLLEFIASTNTTDIPVAVFDFVAAGLDVGQDEITSKLPCWFSDLFPVGEGRKWTDFKLRQALRPLLRYGLIEYSRHQGLVQIYMHPLVRWKAIQDSKERTNITSYDAINAMFHASAALQVQANRNYGSGQVVKFIRTHAPTAEVFLSAPIDAMNPALDMIGNHFEHANRINDARRLYEETTDASIQACTDDSECYQTTIARVVNLMIFTYETSQHSWWEFFLDLAKLFLKQRSGEIPIDFEIISFLEHHVKIFCDYDGSNEVLGTMAKKFKYRSWHAWPLLNNIAQTCMLGIEPEPSKPTIPSAYSIDRVCERWMVSPAGSVAVSRHFNQKWSYNHRTFDDMHRDFEYGYADI
ncbi:hypothetical protein F4806DRAFT_460892 [Annulohypoxylon nitens]|nr:hypothetical protein F4806DRAFT_460892 [Annulohypoxylon nitens]